MHKIVILIAGKAILIAGKDNEPAIFYVKVVFIIFNVKIAAINFAVFQ